MSGSATPPPAGDPPAPSGDAPAPSARERLAQLRERFVLRCAKDHARLVEIGAVERLVEEDDRRAELIQNVHRIAGSAGTFGFAALSTRASAVEVLLCDHPGDPTLAAAMAELRAALAAAAAGSETP